MIKFLRSFLNPKGSSASNRTVLGTPISFDLKEVAYIKASNNRLSALHALLKKYQGTAHEEKIRSVWEKTKKIHAYLLSQKRLHELEMFHLQHTDHFTNTFSLIIDVHQRHKDEAATVISTFPEAEPSPADLASNSNNNTFTREAAPSNITTPVMLPEVIIDSNAKVRYVRENKLGKSIPAEISFTSSPLEKEAFQHFIASKLGIRSIFYAGNALLNIFDNKATTTRQILPIIYWGTHSYALSLNEFRLYPVKIKSKSN